MSLTLHINDPGLDAPDGRRSRIGRAVRAALAEGPRAGGRVGAAEISVTLLDRDAMRALNRDFHDVDRVTDVLAFALDPEPGPDGEGSALLGDVYVCPDVAAASAGELGIEPEEELLRLVLHGVLHLLGYDHPQGDDRYESDMFAVQERLLAGLLDRPPPASG